MFTGLVQAVGTVAEARPSAAGLRLVIDPGAWPHRAAHGESISVSGVCLTHTGTESDRLLAFDAVAETLGKTTLGGLKPGSRVNLEHAVRADTLMGGHFVQGHVDAVGKVEAVNADERDWRVTFSAPPAVMECIVPTGSVCIDGVSLTVAGVESGGRRFWVALIPTTLELTTLRGLSVGDGVNIETDMIARTVVNFMRLRNEPRA
jgi:riboflavin synthase